jgi:hypothetical protein
MRVRLTMAAAGPCLGLGLDQLSVAQGWNDSTCCAATVYVHHRVYSRPTAGQT